MRIAVVSSGGDGGVLRPLTPTGEPAGPAVQVADLASAVAAREAADRPRWVWADTDTVYRPLLRRGVRLASSHDIGLAEALLSGHAGRWGEPRGLPAAWARLTGAAVPPDQPHRPPDPQPALFEPADTGLPPGVDQLDAVVAVHADQLRRSPDGAFRLLLALESAGALAAAEMRQVGLPWRADIHDTLLTELLGARPAGGHAPERLTELADAIAAAFDGVRINPDAPADVLRAFSRAGFRLPSTRAGVLRGVDHPAVPLLLEYKELSRLYVAHGWAWLDAWVSRGRFHPEYVVGGVVSGRWATRGGAALQLPKVVRRAVVADPGRVLVVADAGQLEPRVLAALSDDAGLAAAAGTGDLYGALAAEAFAGDRARAKIALLAAMYGQTSGEAGQLLGTLRRRFPAAVGYVESAARAGEEGRLVRSRLGRTCPSPSTDWWAVAGGPGGAGDGVGAASTEAARQAGQAARARGRFTRNFVVQATAAEWALALLAALRRDLAGIPGADLVFFQHDEVIVHARRADADAVTDAVRRAAADAGRLLFAGSPVRFPVDVAVVSSYSDAK